MKRILVLLLVAVLSIGILIAQDKTEKKEGTKQETKKEQMDCCCCQKGCKMMKSEKKECSMKNESKKDETKKDETKK